MIEVNSLSKTFGSLKVLNNINLKNEAGEMAALIVTSGSNKSIFTKHLYGLVAADKGYGSLIVDGGQVQAGGSILSKIEYLRTRIEMMFHQFNLVGRLNVHASVMLGALGRTPLCASAKFQPS